MSVTNLSGTGGLLKSALVLLFCLMGLSLSAQDNSRPVSLDMTDVPLEQVLESIEEQTDYVFLNKDVDASQKVSINVSSMPVEKALDMLFSGKGITYNIESGHIVLSSETDQVAQVDVPAAGNTVSGTVVDSYGTPVIGAGVLIKGTTVGTSTDLDGKFSFELPEGMENSTLEFTCLGYTTMELPIGNRRLFNVTMKDDTIMMEATVVTALGIKRSEKALSYNVQEVKSDELLANKDANFVNSLNGKVAGLVINASSSGVGGASKVVMRGQKSISKSSNALYVIDGVPMFTSAAEGGTEFDSRGSMDPVADINPEDIESMTVLTGAAAAALYGSAAANGAIVITTKQGQAGKTSVTVTSNTEVFTPFVLPRFQNTGTVQVTTAPYRVLPPAAGVTVSTTITIPVMIRARIISRQA